MNYDLNCTSCSKESYKTIPLNRVFDKLNDLFSRNDLAGVGKTLDFWESEARSLGDERGLLEILNEKIGYYRRTGDEQKGTAAISEAFELIEKRGVGDPISSGTIYLNGATTMKAFGKAQAAMIYYEKARALYESHLGTKDYRLAALYNNVSSAYKDIGDYLSAEMSCIKAIDILDGKEDCLGEIAVSLINLAHVYYDQDPLDERIYGIMDKAWDHLKSDKNRLDGDFAFILLQVLSLLWIFRIF